jgi:hypothetical protein
MGLRVEFKYSGGLDGEPERGTALSMEHAEKVLSSECVVREGSCWYPCCTNPCIRTRFGTSYPCHQPPMSLTKHLTLKPTLSQQLAQAALLDRGG